uniref:Glutamate receptor 2.5 n=1 Tax=Cacopsylla melanoneura TaxID=428564 RepID=A0A8D8QU53_9HEMI
MIISYKLINNVEGFYIIFIYNYASYLIDILEQVPKTSVSKYVVLWPQPGSEDLGRIQAVFAEFWKHQIIDVVAVVQMKYGGIRIYEFEPFSPTRCAQSGPPILVNIWSARFNRLSWKKPLYDRKKKVYNLHGCPLKCMGVHRPPESTIIRFPNNTVKLKGTAIKVFKFVRSTLNFTTDKIIHHVPNNLREQEYLNDTTCIGSGLASGRIDLGFGKFTRLLDSELKVEFAIENQMDCFTWAVPYGEGYDPSIWINFLSEFSEVTWMLIVAGLLVAALFVSWVSQYLPREKHQFQSFLFCCFFVFSSFIGATMKPHPQTLVLRLFFTNWLFYSLVITASYQAYLGSLVTVPQQDPQIDDQIDLLKSNIPIAGSTQMFYVLNASRGVSQELNELLDRFQILPPDRIHETISKISTNKKIAIFSSKSELKYYQHLFQTQNLNSTVSQTQILHIFSQCVLKSYSSPFLFRNGSPFEEPINYILMILFESGLLTYWQYKYNEHRLQPTGTITANYAAQSQSNNARFKTAEFSNFSLNQLYAALVILVACESVAVLVFIYEILYFHMNGAHEVNDESNDNELHLHQPPPNMYHFIH